MTSVTTEKNTRPSWTSSIDPKGAFQRRESKFRNVITADGSSGFKAEANRYHLYVSLACPWAHRTLIVRTLKGLEECISVTVVDWLLEGNGWTFTDKRPKCTLDTVNGFDYLKQVYLKANPEYEGTITVPCLWDKEKETVVNNESSEIIRMFNSDFNQFCQTDAQRKLNFYPEELWPEIETLNKWIYPQINNGVYRCGFAQSQEAYNTAIGEVFNALDKVEDILSKKRYLAGKSLTEADIRLFTTIIRFDSVYHTHFKCNKKRIIDYKNIYNYVCDLYQTGGISETVDMEHIVKHYYVSHKTINPFGIVPIGPELNFNQPHNREKM